MTETGRGVVRWFFADRASGRIVIGQWPNFILGTALGALGARIALGLTGQHRPLDDALALVEKTALTLWAADELLRGVNPWRRLLGAGMLAWLAAGLLR